MYNIHAPRRKHRHEITTFQHCLQLLSPPSVNVVNIGGDQDIGHSVRVSVVLCTWWLIMAMTSLHQQHKQQRRLLLFPPSTKPLSLFPLFSLLYHVVVGVVVFVGVVVVVVMIKSLHLAEICTLTSAFYADDTQSDIGVESRLRKSAPKSTPTSVPSVMRIRIRNRHENSAPKTGAD